MVPKPRPLVLLLIFALAFSSVVLTRAALAGDQTPADRDQAIIIDHRAVAEFARLSVSDLQAASRLKFLLRSASIGENMSRALDCLMDDFSNAPRRPYACDKGVPPNDVVFGSQYNRRNWTMEFRGNPGWYNKVTDFIKRVDGLTGKPFDVVGFNVNYSDGLPGSEIVDRFFATTADDRFGNVAMLEALESRHPDLTFVWWSMTLPRQSSATMRDFNKAIRAYALANHKVLLDLADIVSHGPDNLPCTDNQGQGLEAICPQYTDERNAGHLNAYGGQRAAKAIWVLMARLAARDH